MIDKKKKKDIKYLTFSVVLFFGILFITLDSFLSFMQFSSTSSFLSFLGPNQDKILRAILSMCLFIIFASYINHTKNKYKKLEESLGKYAAALHESDIKYTNILESIDESYYEVTLDGKLITWNRSLVNLIGSTEAEIQKKNLNHYFLNFNNPKIIKAVKAIQAKGTPVKDIEIDFIRFNGARCTIDLAIGQTVDAKGDMTGFRGIARDITEKKKMESLRHEKKTAEIANKTKSEFLANMSHEIRTPLNGVVGMLNLLEETHLSSEQKEYVEMAFISARTLLSVINDILDFSKLEAGKLELEKKSFNLENEINRSMMIFAPRAAEKNLELIARYDPHVPRFVVGDQIRIRQILNNLINNSLKFTQKGYICVNCECSIIYGEEGQFEISVEDTGIGIPEDKLSTIFDNFTQADTSTSRKFGGTGLGLAICKQLVKLMGGEIYLDSVLGEKTIFKLNLNLSLDKRTNPEFVDSEGLLKERVIVVDDNKINRSIFSEYLNSWNIRHDVFPMAMEAYEAMKNASRNKDPYSLLVTDHLMADMDGKELGEKVKSNVHLKETTMVMISSMGTQNKIEDFEKIGFSGHLIKPIHMSDFYNLLQRVIVQRGGPIITGKNSSSPLNQCEQDIGMSKSAKSSQVLLVEDNKINQKASTTIFKKMGFENVSVAENGQIALELVRKNIFDLVLMDIQMPFMDGYEATKKVRELEVETGRKRVPIIAQTANAMKGDKEKCLDAGMDDYISKPIDRNRLIEILNRWLSIRNEEEEGKSSLFGKQDKKNEKGAVPVFDDKAALSRYSDDHKVLREIAHAFIEECPEDFESIQQAVSTQDAVTIAKVAHSVKGSASYVGAERLRQAAYQFELSAKAIDLKQADAMLDSLRTEFSLFKTKVDMYQWEDIRS